MKYLFTYENINNVELIRVISRTGRQLAFVDLANNVLYNTSSSWTVFYDIARVFKFMLTGFQFAPKISDIRGM